MLPFHLEMEMSFLGQTRLKNQSAQMALARASLMVQHPNEIVEWNVLKAAELVEIRILWQL
jgi:hypothetical protein